MELFTPRKTKPSFYFERRLWKSGRDVVAGVDEVGRGCLAGPVVAAAVVLRPASRIHGLNDSKLLRKSEREKISVRIQKRAVSFAVGLCTPEEIDELNILWASMEAMRRAVNALTTPPDYLLVDGNRFLQDTPWPYRAIVKGDQRSKSIAAASIIAKTYRDDLMVSYHDEFPNYAWNTNVGYPTLEHFEAIAEHGPTPLHRRSFNLRLEDDLANVVQPSLFEALDTSSGGIDIGS